MTHLLLFNGALIDKDGYVTNLIQPFASPAEVAAWNATPAQTPGSTPGAIVVSGRIFWLDPADATSGHDGVWTCVSLDSKRYKATDLPKDLAVESRALTAPPALSSAIYQKTWLVPPAATGAWAAHAGDLAVATGRGWLFVPPRVGLAVYVADEAGFYHYSVGGAWTAGLGGPSAGTVAANALAWPFGIVVENRVTAIPPSGATKLAYIVGPSATGAWAGQDGKVAIGPQGGWSFLTPAEGVSVYIKAEGRLVRYLSGAWTANVVSPLEKVQRAALAASKVFAGGYVYSSVTAPIAGNTVEEDLFVTLQAASTSSVLEIEYSADVDLTGAGDLTVALFVDSSASALRWKRFARDATESDLNARFKIDATDTTPHTYRVRIGGDGAVRNRILTIKEFAQ